MFHSSFIFCRLFCSTITTLPNCCNKSSTPLLQTLPFSFIKYRNPLRTSPTPVAVRRRPSKVRHVARVPSRESKRNRPSPFGTYLLLFTFIILFFFYFCYMVQIHDNGQLWVLVLIMHLNGTWWPSMGGTKSKKKKKKRGNILSYLSLFCTCI